MSLLWCHLCLFQCRKVFCTGAEQTDFLFIDHINQHIGPRMEWRTIEQDQRSPARQTTDQPVPHHPAACGEIEEYVIGLEIGVQAVFLAMLQQGSASGMHNAFGHTCGA